MNKKKKKKIDSYEVLIIPCYLAMAISEISMENKHKRIALKIPMTAPSGIPRNLFVHFGSFSPSFLLCPFLAHDALRNDWTWSGMMVHRVSLIFNTRCSPR